MASGLSLSRRRVARACGMEGPRFPNTQTHPYGLSFTLSVRKPPRPSRAVFSQSRSSHQPTPPVRTPRRSYSLTITNIPFFSVLFSFFFFFPFHVGSSTTFPSTYTPRANAIQTLFGDPHCSIIDAVWNWTYPLLYASKSHFITLFTSEINPSLAFPPRLGCTN